MTADELKASVLQMAIEGRLVPQLDDEPAVDMDADSPDDVPFDIPEKWKWCYLKEIVELINGDRGVNYPSKDKLLHNNTGNPFISAINLKENKILYDEKLLFLSDEQLLKLRSGKILNNDILLCIRGSLGKFGIADKTGGAIASSLVILRVKNIKKLYFKYIGLFLNTNLFKKHIINTKNGAVLPNLSAKAVSNFAIPLPPLSEQRRIVEKLEEILPVIEEYGKAHDALQAVEKALPGKLRASLLQEAISGRLVPQRDDEPAVDIDAETPDDVPFAIPEKWKWVRLSAVSFKLQYGYTASAQDNGEVKLLRITDITPNGIKWNSVPFCKIDSNDIEKFRLLQDDIVIARTGGTIGKNYIIKNINYISVFASYLIRIRVYKKLIEPLFMNLYLKTPLYWSQLHNGTRGTGQPNVNAKTLSQLLIPLPPLAEQRRIVERLNELLPSVEAMDKLYQE